MINKIKIRASMGRQSQQICLRLLVAAIKRFLPVCSQHGQREPTYPAQPSGPFQQKAYVCG